MKKLTLVFCAALLLSCVVPAGGDDFSPWDAWRQAYMDFQKGEQAKARGDYVASIQEFNKAMRNYSAVKNARPDWNQKIISARIELCRKEISAVSSLLGRPGSAPQENTEEKTGLKPDYTAENSISVKSEELSQLRNEAEQYKKRLFGALVELDDLRKQAQRSQTLAVELENMLRERRILQEKYRLLQTRYRQLEKKLSAPDSELEAARRRQVELRISLETAEKKLALAEENRILGERNISELHQERIALKNRNNALAGELKKQEDITGELQKFKDKAISEKNELLHQQQNHRSEISKLENTLKKYQQEIDIMTRRFNELSSRGDGKGSLNAEISAENSNLRQEREKMRSQLDRAWQENSALQNKLRTVTLELTDVKNALLALDSKYKTAAEDNSLLRTRLEKQTAAAALTLKEMKNLRLQNQQLDQNAKSWSGKYHTLRKRIDQQDAAALAGVSTLNAELRKSNDALAQAGLKQIEAESEISRLQKALENSITELNTVKKELNDQKAANMAAAQELKKTESINTHRELLKKELAAVQQKYKKQSLNISAMQKELAEFQSLKKQLQQMSSQLETARKNAQDISSLRLQIAGLQRENQLLQESETGKIPSASVKHEIKLPELPAPAAGATQAVDVQAMLNAAQQAEKNSDKEIAVWNYRTILEHEPENFEANLRLGTLMLGDENFSNAFPLLKKAYQNQPGNSTAAIAYARSMNGMKRHGNAMEILRKINPGQTENAGLYYLTLGQSYAGSGMTEDARQSFEKAIAQNQSDPRPYVEMARLLCSSGEENQDKAARFYEKARKLGAVPDTVLENTLGKLLNERSELVDFLAGAAKEAEKHGDASSALWYYSQLYGIMPESADFICGKARNLFLTGDSAQALKAAEEAVNPEILLVKAFILFAGHQYEAAAEAATQAIKLNNGKPLTLKWDSKPLLATLNNAPVDAAGTAKKLRSSIAE